ncbi:hypothetical protein [Propionicimonas sp.]|uniref:hypothetical protein n=1 Tax=Propionicimonas sp. TaxID=1955623 RepID=UPI0039E4925F
MDRPQAKRARLVIVIVLVVVAAVAAWTTVSLLGGTGSPDASAPITPTPEAEDTPKPTVSAPAPPATAAPGSVGGDGSEFSDPFVAAEAASRTDPTTSVDFSSIAVGSALQDLQVNAQEMAEDGIRQVGSPKVVTSTVTKKKLSAKPPRVTVRLCLDYTDVDLVAPDGTSVKDRTAQQRVPSTLVLHEIDGKWLVAKRTFPAKTTC